MKRNARSFGGSHPEKFLERGLPRILNLSLICSFEKQINTLFPSFILARTRNIPAEAAFITYSEDPLSKISLFSILHEIVDFGSKEKAPGVPDASFGSKLLFQTRIGGRNQCFCDNGVVK